MKAGRGDVLALTVVGAAVVTAVDAILLALRRDFFTGGFLAVDSAATWPLRLAFACGSLAMDATCVGFGVLLATWAASRLRWGRAARTGLAFLLGTAPLVVASLVQYELLARLGDAFDLGLMFDLVGRKPVEFVAVASAQMLGVVLALVVGAGTAAVLLGLVNRRFPAGAIGSPRVRTWGWWAAGFLVVIALTTSMRLYDDALDNGLRRKPAGQVLGAVVTSTTDVDRDGYGLLSRPSDPAPFDARVYPYAVDIPGNGVDEDGVGGDLPTATTVAQDALPTRFVQSPPVVVIMLESFRADLVGRRDEGRPVTPVLDALAATGTIIPAFSHNGYTVQSRFHLFTGRLSGQGRPGTLLEDFRRNGYELAYFSGQDESFGGSEYDVGAEAADIFYDARQDVARRYTRFTTAGSLGVSSAVVLERVEAYLARRQQSKPLFLYVSFYDTHFPYTHDGIATLVDATRVSQSDIQPARKDDLHRMYRNTAANVDKAVGELLQLVARHVDQPPVTIVLADHGESLFDEGFLGHGYAINDVQTRIPLIVSGVTLHTCAPIGQADVRAALTSALALEPAAEGTPALPCASPRVFQYLGSIDRPRQIAFTDGESRVWWDFRARRGRVAGGPWLPERDLSTADRERVLAVVHFWERLRLDALTQQP